MSSMPETGSLLVANTDEKWLEHLRTTDHNEANFWRPSGGNITGIKQGELFLFKLKRPHYTLAGGGTFVSSHKLPITTAWKRYGQANGASTFADFEKNVKSLRAGRASPGAHNEIGCNLICSLFYFSEGQRFEVPEFKPNIVAYKIYTKGKAGYSKLRGNLFERLGQLDMPEVLEPRYGTARVVRSRLGQGTFRDQILESYGHSCSITQEKSVPVLEAAHIKPYSEGGSHDISNGLLLRVDIHKLFDEGYVTVTPEHKFRVSTKLKEEYGNGRDYYARDKQEIHVPEDELLRPDRLALERHNDMIFLG